MSARWRLGVHRRATLDAGMLRDNFVPTSSSAPTQEPIRSRRSCGANSSPRPPEAKRLWAEMTWLYLLDRGPKIKRGTKLDRIRTVWEWSREPLPEQHWALQDVLDGGLVEPGIAYLSHQWREFGFIINMMHDSCSHVPDNRKLLLSDPWSFAEWVDGQKDSRRRQVRHAVLFLLFPDAFEPMMSVGDKKDIIKAFTDETGETPDVEIMDLIDLDKALRAVVQRLQDERPGGEVLFYHPPLKERWQDSLPPQYVTEKRPSDDEWYRNRFATADVWAIGAGEGARLWRDFLEHGIAAVGYGDIVDVERIRVQESHRQNAMIHERPRAKSKHALARRDGNSHMK